MDGRAQRADREKSPSATNTATQLMPAICMGASPCDLGSKETPTLDRPDFKLRHYSNFSFLACHIATNRCDDICPHGLVTLDQPLIGPAVNGFATALDDLRPFSLVVPRHGASLHDTLAAR